MFTIFESGIGHEGNFNTACTLIYQAKRIGCDMVKFQSYRAAEILGIDSPFYEEADKAQFSCFQLKMLRDICSAREIEFGLSLFHPDQVDFAENDLRLSRYKISSRSAFNKDLLFEINLTHKPVIMSLGLIGLDKTLEALDILHKCDVSLLYCVCNYPTRIEDLDWNGFEAIKKLGRPVGFSSHCPDPEATLESVRRGAEIIENHVKPDGYNGCDASSSMTLFEYENMIKEIRHANANAN